MQNLGSSRLLPLLLRHAQPLSGAAGGSSVCSTAASLRAVSTSVASRAGPWGPGHDIGKTVDDSHIGQVDYTIDQPEGVPDNIHIQKQQEGSGPTLDEMRNTPGMYPGMGTSQLTPGEQEPDVGGADPDYISLDHIPARTATRGDTFDEVKYTYTPPNKAVKPKEEVVDDMPHRTNASPLGGPDQPPAGGQCYSG